MEAGVSQQEQQNISSVTIVTICGSFKQQSKSVTDRSLIAFSLAHSFLPLTAHYIVDVFVPNLQSVVFLAYDNS